MRRLVAAGAAVALMMTGSACEEKRGKSSPGNSLYTYEIEVGFVAPAKRKITGQYWYGVERGGDLKEGRVIEFSTESGLYKAKLTTLGPKMTRVVADGPRTLYCTIRVTSGGKLIKKVTVKDPTHVACGYLT